MSKPKEPTEPLDNQQMSEQDAANELYMPEGCEIIQLPDPKAQPVCFGDFLKHQSPGAMYAALIAHVHPKTLNAIDFLITRTDDILGALAPGQPLRSMMPDDPEAFPAVVRVLKWRKFGLENHWFCQCHSRQN